MLKGVLSVEPGYAGGTTKNPTYYDVYEGKGGHALTPSLLHDGVRPEPALFKASQSSGNISYGGLGVTSRSEGGHAEVVQITYDPALVKPTDLLTVFFATHDPTIRNRQGADTGPAYRSVILYTNDPQKETAQKFIADLNASNEMGRPVVTDIEPLDVFYPAEAEHRDYYERNKSFNLYCELVINPKLEKVQASFVQFLKNKH